MMTLEWALGEPDAAEFIKAMENEVANHVECGHWKVVSISTDPKGNKLILAVWSKKRK